MGLQRVRRDLVTEQEQHGSIRRIMVQLSVNLDSVFIQETGCNNKPKFFLISDKMKLVFIIFFLKTEPFQTFSSLNESILNDLFPPTFLHQQGLLQKHSDRPSCCAYTSHPCQKCSIIVAAVVQILAICVWSCKKKLLNRSLTDTAASLEDLYPES